MNGTTILGFGFVWFAARWAELPDDASSRTQHRWDEPRECPSCAEICQRAEKAHGGTYIPTLLARGARIGPSICLARYEEGIR